MDRSTFHDRILPLFPAAFLLHFLEEAPGFVSWVDETLGGTASGPGFVASNAVFMLVLLALCAWSARSRTAVATTALFVWVGAQQYGNFVFHLHAQVAFARYSPGVLSASLLYAPLYVLAGYVAVRDGHVRAPVPPICAVGGVLLMYLFAWINLYRAQPFPWAGWLSLG